MKRIILTTVLPFLILVGCENDTDKLKRQCIKNPNSPDCLRSSHNVVRTPPKDWEFGAMGSSSLKDPTPKHAKDLSARK